MSSKQDPWIPINCPTSTGVVRSIGGIYGGYSLRETSGSAGATVKLYDSVAAPSGTTAILGEIVIPQGDFREVEMKWGVRALFGIWVVITGAVEGSIRTN